MTSAVIRTSKKVDWENIASYAIIVVVIYAVINALVCGMIEGNIIIWLGVIALLGSVLWYTASMDNKNLDWWYHTQLCFSAVFALFFVAAPFMHLGGGGKVWMIGDETTISHQVLWRTPFSSFATSINKSQDASFTVSGRTKDGTAVVATLSGGFSISDDEKVVIKHFGKMQNPDIETAALLKKVLQKSFEQTISTMTVTDIATAKNNFAIEHVIIAMTAVDSLGLVGSGPIVVSNLHPYFVDK